MDTTEKLVTARELLWMPDELHCRTELIAGKVVKRQFAYMNEASAASTMFLRMWDNLPKDKSRGIVISASAGYHIKSDLDYVRVP